MSKLIVFDLNKTLIEENSWLELNLGLGVKQEEDDMLMSWGSEGEGIISDQQGQDILCAIYKKRGDVSRDNIMKILSKYTYKPSAKETVKQLQDNGFEVSLISGSMDVLVEKVAKELGIQKWACNNRFVFDDLDKLDRIETENDDFEYKLRQLEELCKELGIEPKETICVGDGNSDTKLFEVCGISITLEGSAIADKATHTIKILDEITNLAS